MGEQKTIGQIAFEAAKTRAIGPIGEWISHDAETKDAWEFAASAVWDQAVEACISRVNTQRAIFADEEYSSGQPYTTMAERFACEQIAEDLRSLKRSDKTESGCQADAGAKGDTVSREGALQSTVSAEAFYLDQSAWEGLRPAVRWRLGAAVAKLIRTGTLNRQDIEEMGEVSTPQASADISEIMKRLPHLMAYDKSRKCYVLAANSQSSIEEPERSAGDTMPLTSGETPDTNNQDADNG